MKSTKDFEERYNYCIKHRYKEFYPNGYGISISPDLENLELFEVAVLKGNEYNYDLCFETYITDDVVKGLTSDEVEMIKIEIKGLKRSL
ncbi:hypothetical protein [Leptotrichia sp.]|uniref:hypothetical protein n=1 Tax=Leptotrichia sp. TaxID=104608 RepID=UPI001804DB50|nr:hypothetical protein [Leptotrichia sp.]MBB1534099.1 hypothetical protein [Leptotrichia sp.]